MAKEINLFEEAFNEEVKEERVEAVVPQGTEEENVKISFTKRLELKRIIESLLFVSSDPLSFAKIREVTDAFVPLKPRQLNEIIEELKQDLISQNRSFRLVEIANGYLLRTCEEFRPYVELLYRNKRSEKLTQASLEVLAIIAYRQPITRPQIEAIRGVDSSGTLQNLLERELIEQVGRLEAPGRPSLYGITPNFLKHFGLRNLDDLPNFEKNIKRS